MPSDPFPIRTIRSPWARPSTFVLYPYTDVGYDSRVPQFGLRNVAGTVTNPRVWTAAIRIAHRFSLALWDMRAFARLDRSEFTDATSATFDKTRPQWRWRRSIPAESSIESGSRPDGRRCTPRSNQRHGKRAPGIKVESQPATL